MTLAVEQTDHPLLSRLAFWAAQAFEKSGEGDMIAWMDEDLIKDLTRSGKITPDQLFELAKAGPHSADEMLQMMRALGIDPMEVETRYETLYRDMQVNCAHCTAKDTCRESLAADQARHEFDGFCANADDMRWLKATPAVLSE